MGLKWLVRLEPETPKRKEYLSVTRKSLVTRASTERKPGKRAWLGRPTYCWMAEYDDQGNPDRYSTLGMMRNLSGSAMVPQPMKRFGASPGRLVCASGKITA